MAAAQLPAPGSEAPAGALAPPGAMLELAESQTHRRFFKSHVPYDSLPVYEGVKIIHVARDGRDAAMSFYNHKLHYTDDIIDRMTQIALADPKFGTPTERTEPDPARHFHEWVLGEADQMGDPACGFWHMEHSYWAARSERDVLLVHYADLKADLEREMRRIAEFLGIRIDEVLWPDLIHAATFESMKSKAAELMPTAADIWQGGGDTFLHKGVNGRWRDVYEAADLALYDAKVRVAFPGDLARWIEFGRLGV